MTKKKKKRKKKYISLLIILVIIILGVLGYIYYNKSLYKVILKDNLTIEVNSEFNIDNYIEEIVNGKIDSIEDVDTSNIGNYQVRLNIKNKYNKISKYYFNILIIDTESPIIESRDSIEVFIGSKIDLLDGVKVIDNSNELITPQVLGEYDLDKVGTYNLKYEAKDSSNNLTTKEFKLIVKSKSNEIKVTTFTTSNGHTGKIIDGVTYIDGYLIANKTYSLPKDYGNGLTSDTQKAFNMMKNDASILGLNLYISSGYRSYWSQYTIYNNYVKRDGQKNADTYSARAGHSEHQTGLAFDLNSINDSFSYTEEGKWVRNNCYKYGLILRYVDGKEEQTGYMYESWHLRYVGLDLAEKLYNNGDWLTMEEYFGITSVYS